MEKSFAATLVILLIIVEWCVENWADYRYIEYWDIKVRESFIEREVAPISAAETSMAIEKDPSDKSITTSPAASKQNTFPRQTTSGRDHEPPTSLLTQIDTSTPETPEMPVTAGQQSIPSIPVALKSPPGRRTSNLRQLVVGMFTKASSSEANKDEDMEMGHRNSHESELFDTAIDEKLSLKDFMRMSRWSSELEQSIMVIGQNLGVVGQMKKHCREIIDSHEFKQHIRADGLTSRISTFFNRIDEVESDLTVHRERLKAVARTVKNDKVLYGATLSEINSRVAEYFSRVATESTSKMEEWSRQMQLIAIKTEHETVSMHVITIFTLLFLPGTFVAVRYGWPSVRHFFTAGLTQIQTFFGSGAIQWDEDGTLGTDYIARPGGMKLFFMIIVPLTVVVMMIWGLIYWIARRERKIKEQVIMLLAEMKTP